MGSGTTIHIPSFRHSKVDLGEGHKERDHGDLISPKFSKKSRLSRSEIVTGVVYRALGSYDWQRAAEVMGL
jgi:hypothetical protein